MIELAAARETFEGSADFTVGIEEEFALVDPQTLLLVPRFELLRDAAASDPVLATSIAGELISSEIEIRSGAGSDVEDAPPPPGGRAAGGCSGSHATTASRSARPARMRSATTASSTSSTPSTTTASKTG